jgi:hypothetical protein
MRIMPLLALTALLAGVLHAAGPAPPAALPMAPLARPTAGAAQQVFLDPLTGLAREPTADELALLRAASQASAKVALRSGAAAPEEIHLPDGTGGQRLDQQYFDTVVVCRQPDGHFGSDCPAARSAR